MHANASQHATRDYVQIAREFLAEARAVDRSEDEQHGARRGDEPPPELSTAQGRRGWLREAKRRLDEERAWVARSVPRSRPAWLRGAKRRLEEELDVECRANATHEARGSEGRPALRAPAGAYQPPATPVGSCFPCSADMNPALTSAAQALRVVAESELAS